MWARETTTSSSTASTKSRAPGSSGARDTSFTRPPEAATSRWNISTSGAWSQAPFWAPFLASERKGPSRLMPHSSAPPLWAALWAAATWHTFVSCSSGRVMPAGQIWVTPLESSYSAMISSPSGSASEKSRPMQPWKCRSVRPGMT